MSDALRALKERERLAERLAKEGKPAEAVRAFEDVAEAYARGGHFFEAAAVCRVVLGLDPAQRRCEELIASLYARAPAGGQQGVSASDQLPVIPLFSALSRDELKELLRTAMEVRAFHPEETIVREGEPGEALFALVEGSAGIYRGWGTANARRVAHLSAGDVFGEVALMSGAPRMATVVVDGAGVALELRKAAIGQVSATHPGVGEQLERFYRERLFENALRASPILKGLSETDRRALSAAFAPSTFEDGQQIITEGQAAESVYMLLRGSCLATHQSGNRYPDLREGDLFGELSALGGGAATATVTAAGKVLTLRLSAGEFRARVLKDPSAMRAVRQLAQTRLTRTAQFDEAREEVIDGQPLAEDLRV